MRSTADPTARRLLLAAVAAVLLTGLGAAPPTGTADATPTGSSSDDEDGVAPAATGALLREGPAFYPRAVRLEHNGEADGRVLASVVTFVGNADGIGAIYESTDDGASFTQVGTVADPEAADDQGLCCATLYELPRQIGDMPAGTLLWAASVGAHDRPMSLRIWRSNDIGRTWSYLSTCATAANSGGLWEPEFSIDAAGRLVCHYADETDPGHNQKLMAARSADGVTWTQRHETVTSDNSNHRPGMPVVRRLPNGSYIMSYEICALGGQYDCAVHVRHSADGWNWGDPASRGIRVHALDGKYFTHAPTIAWAPSEGNSNGKILLVGQILQNPDGSVAPDNGRTILVNTENGYGRWYEIEAPVAVSDPYNNFCPNYSSALLPSIDGDRVLEIASDDDGGSCRSYFATGSAIGSQDAAGVADGATYRLVNVQSGHCLDVAGDSREPGGNVHQWTCNGLGPQDWIVDVSDGGHATLTGRNSGLCLDVQGDSMTPGANVQQWTCIGAGNQDWRITNVGRGYYTLVARNSGLCLDVAGGSFDPGANVQQWTCNNLQPQIWRFERR